jgi:hypothetical protein
MSFFKRKGFKNLNLSNYAVFERERKSAFEKEGNM